MVSDLLGCRTETFYPRTWTRSFLRSRPTGSAGLRCSKTRKVFPGDFSLCRNGRFIIFGKSTSGDSIAIWRLDFTGHNLKQLTEGPSDM